MCYYLDIVIGAPYEERGAIYIYLGGADGLREDRRQRVLASDLKHEGLNGFGFALKSGTDYDGNSYNGMNTITLLLRYFHTLKYLNYFNAFIFIFSQLKHSDTTSYVTLNSSMLYITACDIIAISFIKSCEKICQ